MRRLSWFDVAGVLALALFGIIAVRLADSERGPMAEQTLELTAEDVASGFREGESWQGLYHRGNKVGFLRVQQQRLEAGYRVSFWQVMRLSLMGRRQEIAVELTTDFDEGFVLRSFNGSLDTDGTTMEISGGVSPPSSDDGPYIIDIAIETDGGTMSDIIEIAEAPRVQQGLHQALIEEEPEVGETYETTFFDPMSQAQRAIILEYQGRETLVIMGEAVSTHRVIQHMAGQELTAWVNDLGEVLKEELPLGLMGVRETRAEAMYGVTRENESEDADNSDLIESAAIAVTADVPDLSSIPNIVWRLENLSDPAIFDLAEGRQRQLEAAVGEAVRLRIIREPHDRGLQVDEVPRETLTPYLEPALFLQSDDERIVRAAHEMAGDESGVASLVDIVNQWVFENLEKQSEAGIPTAVDVLQSLRGDCNEHATIMVALLRALGVPARIAAGIAYVPPQEDASSGVAGGAFYYHAWVEYWHNGWRTADPTWGQHPADLGHIRLVSGGLDRQIAISETFGRLRVEPEL